MGDPEQESRLSGALGSPVVASARLSGGCVADVHRVDLADGRRVVVKSDPGSKPGLAIEGMMLDRLAKTGVLPVPSVLLAKPDLLVIEHIENNGRRSDRGEAGAADMLASLHSITADRFGYPVDTLIGSLDQTNGAMDSWPRFFAERRVLEMGRRADRAGSLPAGTLDRLGKLAQNIDRLVDPLPARPSLIHGDVWSGNVLWHEGKVAAMIDPAIYFADHEIELAFIDLFGCFGQAFWDRYAEVGTIRPGFREVRKDLYNLYPLLVHATLFGGGYGANVAGTLASLGY